jgi:antitoxin component YwqK of YwqJK toxin-antitoxin module
MKKIITLLLLFLPLFLRAQDTTLSKISKVKKFFYDNGRVASEGYFKNGKPDGNWKAFYQNSQLKSEGNRVDGLLDGQWIFYSETGQKTSEINYSKGQENGWKKEFYQNNKPAFEQWMSKGVKDSIFKSYHTKGYLQKVQHFRY